MARAHCSPAAAGYPVTPCSICRAPITSRNTPTSSPGWSICPNKQYSTAGFLTSNAFNPNGVFRPDPADWTNENAVSPARRAAVWAGRAHTLGVTDCGVERC